MVYDVFQKKKHVYLQSNSQTKTHLNMKHYLFICVAFSIFVSSCTDDNTESQLTNQYPSPVAGQSTRSLEEALSIAERAGNLIGGFCTRASSREVDPQNVKVVLQSSTRATSGGDTLLYVVNFANGQGFAVVSANENTEGLLAVTEEGTYDEDATSNESNEAFDDFMELAKLYVESASTASAITNEKRMEFKSRTDTIKIVDIKPKVELQWGQTNIEGTYCPNGIAGCANVAMAQMMSYFCSPTSITVDYRNAPVSSLNLDWSAIKAHKSKHLYGGCTATDAAHEAIKILARQLGEDNESVYSVSGTSTNSSKVRKNFKKMGFKVSDITKYSNQNFETILNTNGLVYMWGYKSNGSGHSWVVDGTYHIKTLKTTWSRYKGDILWTLSDKWEYEVRYLHMNWGYYGSYNGYFNSEVYKSWDKYKYDYSDRSNNGIDVNYYKDIQYFSVSM